MSEGIEKRTIKELRCSRCNKIFVCNPSVKNCSGVDIQHGRGHCQCCLCISCHIDLLSHNIVINGYKERNGYVINDNIFKTLNTCFRDIENLDEYVMNVKSFFWALEVAREL